MQNRPVHSLTRDQQVQNDQMFSSPNGKYHAIMQQDGNFVVYNSRNKQLIAENAIWASNTWQKGAGPYRCIMQADGNLVVYDSHNHPTWASGTNGKGDQGHYVLLQNDGNLVVYDGRQLPVWSTGISKKKRTPEEKAERRRLFPKFRQ